MNQNYTVLARKYRPNTISTLKGQDVLVTTLNNAFKSGRIAHAFLLSGVRGVGKTTTARILAKALNCIGEDSKGNYSLNPCNKCEHCTSINNDSCLDVLEMDAASKTGIDDMREIIDTIKYQPIKCRYKVYIIDEIHMLSKSAFNALLKTLEEPPKFVKFIFATTEIKKVPITIISRCQRFDLKRLTSLQLKEHLAEICTNENINFEEQALSLIANAAEGSVRDSLSILDQAINSSNGYIKENIVIELLGRGNKKDHYELFQALISNNHEVALNIVNNLYNNGIEIILIFEELLEICHLVTMIKTTILSNPTNKLNRDLYLTEEEQKAALNIANQVTLNSLIILWQILTKGLEELKISTFPKKVAEMLIIRITWINEVATLPLLQKILSKNLTEVSNSKKQSNTRTTPSPISSYATNNSSENTHLPDKSPVLTSNQANLEDILEIFPKAEIVNKKV